MAKRPDTERGDPEVRRQEDAAADEAGRIGGRSGMEDMNEAERASAEHGGGESEGFEQAEELLEDQASHGDSGGDPLADSGEAEPDRDRASHGEPDRVDSTETGEDTRGTSAER
jgi:hypothetical protein